MPLREGHLLCLRLSRARDIQARARQQPLGGLPIRMQGLFAFFNVGNYLVKD
jgi:hypothetical protein